uniref:Uncharacterized protein n=1 Tax=Scophthalmus maximus TaxID=52904 RepID=A0A8D3ADE7_SCOMX
WWGAGGSGLTMVCFLCAEAIENMITCYVLDGILILYGIVLTVLYCRLRVRRAAATHDDTTSTVECRTEPSKILNDNLNTYICHI